MNGNITLNINQPAMKPKYILSVLFLLTAISLFSQTGIQCDGCKGMNGNHTTSCPYYNPPSKSSSGSSGTSLETQIMGAIFQSVIQSMFAPSKADAEPTAAEKAQIERNDLERQKQMALRQAKLKRYNDSIAEARHDKMMKDYKPLPGSGNLAYKGLDDNKKRWAADVNFNCKITGFKGDVRIVKADGSIRKFSADQPVDLAPGDWIYTNRDSRIKLHYEFENEGKDIIVGQNSFVNIITDENGTHLPNLVNGRTYIRSSIVDEMDAVAGEDIMSLKRDLEESLSKQQNLLKRKFMKPALRTPTCVLANRGTAFSVSHDSLNVTTLSVFEGAVDLTGLVMGYTVTVEAGNKYIVGASGEISGPIKIEDSDIDKWWDE